MALAHLDQLAAVAQPVEGELADRLQQPVSAVGIVEQHEALVDQSTDTSSTAYDVTVSPSAVTASAASSGKPPWNTARRRNTARSVSSSRSTLQAIEASSVCWRGIAVRAPPDSSRNA